MSADTVLNWLTQGTGDLEQWLKEGSTDEPTFPDNVLTFEHQVDLNLRLRFGRREYTDAERRQIKNEMMDSVAQDMAERIQKIRHEPS